MTFQSPHGENLKIEKEVMGKDFFRENKHSIFRIFRGNNIRELDQNSRNSRKSLAAKVCTPKLI